jgi:hypothetical protein
VIINREWRRQFPVPFRYLEDQKFGRWQWVEYDWREPKGDPRSESQRVQEGTIKPGEIMPEKERAAFLQPLIFGSTAEAQEQGHTLALIRPIEPKFSYAKKDEKQIEEERAEYAKATDQLSFLTQQQEPLKPCPYEFRFKYQTEDGPHNHKCGDWETAAMFYRFSRRYGEAEALRIMDQTFNKNYPEKGMAFAMGTDSRYPIWLLVGVLRLDKIDQMALL